MKFNVFGKIVTLKEVKNLSSDRGIYGEYNPKSSVIIISKELKGDIRKITELHEFFHSCINRLGLHNAQLSSDLEEILVDGLATALVENASIKWKKTK